MNLYNIQYQTNNNKKIEKCIIYATSALEAKKQSLKVLGKEFSKVTLISVEKTNIKAR